MASIDATTQPLWRQKTDLERVKREGLDADLERLEREGYESLTAEEFYRLKLSGVCSQRTAGLHMIRIRVPGGRLTAPQLRGMRRISHEFADGEAHITTRQSLELHSVPSRLVRGALGEISGLGLSTRSTCGHTVRNIVACTHSGVAADAVFDTWPTVLALDDFFLARAGRNNARLPRRVNISVAGCHTCMPHAQTSDIGFTAVRLGSEDGFQLWCAGSHRPAAVLRRGTRTPRGLRRLPRAPGGRCARGGPRTRGPVAVARHVAAQPRRSSSCLDCSRGKRAGHILGCSDRLSRTAGQGRLCPRGRRK
ncbi:MAG: hypothetical protein WDA27_10840 [Actinomycetota bacterium]